VTEHGDRTSDDGVQGVNRPLIGLEAD